MTADERLTTNKKGHISMELSLCSNLIDSSFVTLMNPSDFESSSFLFFNPKMSNSSSSISSGSVSVCGNNVVLWHKLEDREI